MTVRQKMLELCWKVETLPASELQTEISVMASGLLAEVEQLEAEVERLKQYTDPRLFAAACNVLHAWDDDQFNDAEFLEVTVEELDQAVKWWDSLPFDPDKDVEKLPKYEG